ncbi:MAG: TonB-dependent receptor [Woeseiaceae bacterium]|nr:TonB-dependent receptor [Woeseiaceae bacterium]
MTAVNAAEPRRGDAPALDEIVVTSQRRPEPMTTHTGNIARVSADEVSLAGHQHIHELLSRVSGVWISRGSGQESLASIRSPVLTGAGSCGAFLTLEDGIPTRPSGFCNVNQLFEINTEQAQRLEIVRGPGNALYGSNALHGIVNVILPAPGEPLAETFSIETGSNEFLRLAGSLPMDRSSPLHAMAVLTDDDGFRDDAGYRQAKVHAKLRGAVFGGDLLSGFSASDLDQQTAGFITGQDAYRDDAVNRSNPNPEAFRDASSQRLYAIWTRDAGRRTIDLRPYVRHSDMSFLQHFLPGQPLEENGHVSAGLLASMQFAGERSQLTAGFDVEWSDVFLEETQAGPATGSPFLIETRPVGRHYDYSVAAYSLAPYVQAEFAASERVSLSAGLRGEWVRYDYDNRMLDGNTRDDGTPCGFGGCLYTRPADRKDDFTNLAPKLGARLALSADTTLYASVARGFRAPQMTELYRLQSGQQVADLDSERLDSAELGLRLQRSSWSFDGSAYLMKKRGSVFRDANGFNVSGARSRHRGVEVALNWQALDSVAVSIDASYAKHTYDFNQVAARGESFVSGRDVDTAPRWLASVEIVTQPADGWIAALQWSTIGPYYLDAENSVEYRGHRLVNGIAAVDIGERFTITARANNLFAAEYADRADFAFDQYRYFPGRGREFFVELAYISGGNNESL